ncbi:hypothetical protein IJ750_00135 [bacterium]|nr:hypothetical protein [bacterium]
MVFNKHMNILPVSVNQQTNFKSAYPVVHWVAEANGSYAPVANLELVKKLQSKVVRVLNKPLDKSKKEMVNAEQRLRAYMGSCDLDYRLLPKVRSFYNKILGSITSYSPVSYIISGKDVEPFENMLAKDIGRKKGDAREFLGTTNCPEVCEAVRWYNRGGLRYVNNPAIRVKDKSGMTYVLHTKFEIIRNKLGKIKDYKFVDARFMPEYGPNSPFEKIKS